ncbi:MAG: helix-hairpin-helix domain-containing protein [Bacteroidales bacterium]|nr:helix-hairpin-helix domain-containing protein [Bacteroidales bacterium]
MKTLALKLLIFIYIFCLSGEVHSQTLDSLVGEPESLLEGMMEQYTSATSSETDFSQWFLELETLKFRPVNINSMNQEELQRLPLLNDQQIMNLQAYTREYGLLASIYELQWIDGFNQVFIDRIAPYITIEFRQEDDFKLKNAFKYGHSKIEMRYQRIIEDQSGYEKVSDSQIFLKPNNYYTGNQDGLAFRYRYSYRDQLQLGIVAEKDAGEALFGGPDSLRKGFDYYSWHLYLKNIRKLSYLALGDYQVQFGQGLTLSTGLSMGMISGILPSRKRATLIKPHNSFNENTFFRGIAIGIRQKRFLFTTFYSMRKKDGNLVNSDSTEDASAFVTSIQESGYHRTIAEIADKKVISEQLMGLNIQWSGSHVIYGATYYHSGYSLEIQKKSDPSDLTSNGTAGGNYLGVDYSYSYKRMILYGEGSYQLNGGYAFIQGLNLSLHPMLTVSSFYRSTGFNYINNYSAISSSSGTNKSEWYMGIETVFKKFRITAYTDFQKYSWLRYRVDSPSLGSSQGIELLFTLGRKGETRLRYKNSINAMNRDVELEKVQKIGYSKKQDFQWTLSYQPLPWLRIGNKVYISQLQSADAAKEKAYMISQDLKIQAFDSKLGFMLRYTMFDTDSYESRLYSYENDLPSSFSVPALNGRGSRYYLMLQLNVIKDTDIWIRYSRTCFPSATHISEGSSQIASDHKSDIRLMVSFRF